MTTTIKIPHDAKADELDLPALPSGVLYLLSALGEEDIGVPAIATAVERIPSIAARLVMLANSAWVNPVRPVTSLPDACSLLGVSLVRSVSIALAVGRPFDPSRSPGFDGVRFWSAALMTAEGMTLLSPHLAEDRKSAGGHRDTLRTAGLLHNLGLLWMADRWPARTAPVFQSTVTSADGSLVEALRAATDTDYCEIGGQLGVAWRLPEVLTVVMQQHRTYGYQGPHWRDAAGCGIAASMAAALWHDADWVQHENPLGISTVALESIFCQLTIKRESIRKLARALFNG